MESSKVNDIPGLRARLSVSQDKEASKVGISRQTLSSYESKKREMPWSVYSFSFMHFK